MLNQNPILIMNDKMFKLKNIAANYCNQLYNNEMAVSQKIQVRIYISTCL